MLPVGQNRPTAETAIYETRLSSFKVNELQSLLGAFRIGKLGKKNELYQRCVELLRSPSHTKNVIERIKEIETRVNPQRASPYPLPNMNPNQNVYQQQGHQMYGRPNGMSGYNPYMPQPNMNHNHYGGMMHQNMANNTMSINPRPARHLTAMPLPFYDPIHTLVEPQELPPNQHGGNKMPARMEVTFTLSAEHYMKLSVRESEFPRTEVQLRFFNATGDILNIEQPDDFPLNCGVRLNELNVTLPNVIPTNKPNQEPKRPSRPVNITQQIINAPREKKHSLKIEWTADKRQWAVAIYVVTRVDSNILRNRIMKSPSYELPYATTEATIRKRLGGGDDDDVAMDSLKISLLCPLMKTRMKIAARCRDCTHLQCFDLDSYLMLNEKKPAWKCGVCNQQAPYHKLIIDKYFMKMLEDLGPLVTDVELLKDGSYRVIKEDDVLDLSDDDDCDVKPTVGGSSSAAAGGGSRGSSTGGGVSSGGAAGGSSTAAKAAAPAAAAAASDVITLSDDEDNDQELLAAIRASMPSSATDLLQSPKRLSPLRSHQPSSPPSDDSIIILDDTPPRPEPVSSRTTASTSSVGSSSNWRTLPSVSTANGGGSGSGSGPASVVSTSSPAGAGGAAVTSAAAGAAAVSVATTSAASSAGGGAGSSGMFGQQQQQRLTLADALGQNQHQQQPQSAPPVVNNMNAQWAQYVMGQGQYGYGGYGHMGGYGGQQQPQPQPQGYGGSWAPPNGPPMYAQQQHNGGGVIRRNDELRDPRDPR